MRKDEIMKLYPDIRKVKKTFNWKPSVEIKKRGFKALLKAILIKNIDLSLSIILIVVWTNLYSDLKIFKMSDLIKTDYLNNGFVISKPLMDEISIKILRKELDDEFKDFNDGVSINITDFKNIEVTKKYFKY